jgi:hypothetical protein
MQTNCIISHIEHTANVVAKTLTRSTEWKTKNIFGDQFRFRREEETMDATRTLRTPPIRTLNTDEELCASLIDSQKIDQETAHG